MKFILALLLLTTGCASSIKREMPKHREPSKSADVYTPPNGFTIKSAADIPKNVGTVNTKNGVIVWDLQGAILDGSKQTGKCDQSTTQEPLFRAKTGLYVKNGFVRNAKDALSFYSPDSGVEKITWLNVCEDAVASHDNAVNFIVKDCESIGRDGNDKHIQLNQAKGARVTGNIIYKTVTGIRFGSKDTNKPSEVGYVGGNTFIEVDTAYNVSSITMEEVSKSKFDGVKTEYKFANGAKKK